MNWRNHPQGDDTPATAEHFQQQRRRTKSEGESLPETPKQVLIKKRATTNASMQPPPSHANTTKKAANNDTDSITTANTTANSNSNNKGTTKGDNKSDTKSSAQKQVSSGNNKHASQQKGKANHHQNQHHYQNHHQNQNPHHQQQQRTGQPREHRKILRNNHNNSNNSTNANKQHVQQVKQTKQPNKEESTTIHNHSEAKENGDVVREHPTQAEPKTDVTPIVSNGIRLDRKSPPEDEKTPVLQDANKNEIKITTEKPLVSSEEAPVKTGKDSVTTTTNSSDASHEIQQES